MTDCLHSETQSGLVLRFDRVPVKHDFSVLLDDDCRDLTDDQKLEHVDSHRKDEKELDLLTSLFVFEVETVLVGGKNHGSKHLEDCTLEISEAFQLVAPSIRDNVRKHNRKGPPQQTKENNERADVGNDVKRALDVRQELEEGEEESDKQNQIDGLHIVQNLVVVDQGAEVDHLLPLVQDFDGWCLFSYEYDLGHEHSETEQTREKPDYSTQSETFLD